MKFIILLFITVYSYCDSLASVLSQCNCTNMTKQFYAKNSYKPVFVNYASIYPIGIDMSNLLNDAYLEGLDPRNYHTVEIRHILNRIDNGLYAPFKDLMRLDILLTDGFFRYANNVHSGAFTIQNTDFTTLLYSTINENNLDNILKQIEPRYFGYSLLKKQLNLYQKVAIRHDWKNIPNISKIGDENKSVELLQQRLAISGEYSGKISGVFNERLEKAVMLFQLNNGIYPTGIVNDATLYVLNIPIKKRIQLIELNLDRMRSLNVGKDYVLVNLPEYSLVMVNNDKITLKMDVAVGDSKHPSCILNSKISDIVVNPFWYIPQNIALTELLPELQDKGNAFLVKKQIDVLMKNSLDQFITLDPANINWKAITPQELAKYHFRQQPSEDNSLGKFKFLFDNQCQIYLHDTNESKVFDLYRRDFSHGCIRLSDPKNFADRLLTYNNDWENTRIEELFANHRKSIDIKLKNQMNLYISYFTAFANNDWVQFRDDMYNLDNASKYVVYLPAMKK